MFPGGSNAIGLGTTLLRTTALGVVLSGPEGQESLVLGKLDQCVNQRQFELNEAGPWAELSNPLLGLLQWLKSTG